MPLITCCKPYVHREALTLPKQTLVFTCLQSKSFENTAGKGEIARNERFLIFPHCFLPIWITFFHFHLIQNCRLQALSVWESLKFIVWEKVKPVFATVWFKDIGGWGKKQKCFEIFTLIKKMYKRLLFHFVHFLLASIS